MTADKGRPRASAHLKVSVQYAVPSDGLPSRRDLRLWARAALVRDAALTLRLVDEAEGRTLNRSYRGRDYATNVLTFAYGKDGTGCLGGDIVLCAPVVAREAGAQGKAAEAHWAHLVVHGLLHLQGYDHERGERDAVAMEAVEGFIMQRLGYPDPYLEDERRQ
jgi:probable rRNA maturation factor